MKSLLKTLLFNLFIILLSTRCGESPQTTTNLFSPLPGNERNVKNLKLKSIIINDNRPGIWGTTNSGQSLVFVEKISNQNANLPNLINLLNKNFPESYNPGLQLQKIDKNAVFLKVVDSQKLTQRMGTAGAISYLAIVTYTLTSLYDISVVYFDFIDGDHATSGYYTRADFLNYFDIQE